MSFQPTATRLPCPKCALPMRVIERSGVHIEQCPECRGVFLDRGELDRLLDLESSAVPGYERRAARPEPGAEERATDRGWRDRDRDDEDEGWGRGRAAGRDPKRRRGFLSEFFEGFGD